MKTLPLVSILIPYYNDKKFLSESIESVLNSTYRNFELFLLNHASTDGSYDIAHKYNDNRIKYIDLSINYGAGGGILVDAFLQQSRGKYIKFFCADDKLTETGLFQLVSYMEENKEVDFAFGDLSYINTDSILTGQTWSNNRKEFSFTFDEIDYIRQYCNGISSLPWVGSIVKRESLSKISINKTFVMLFDMSIWLSLLCNGCRIGFVNSSVALYRIHDGQVSSPLAKEKVLNYSYFEHKLFWKYFLTISDVELVKKIWPNSRFNNNLNDKQDIPFVVAYNLFINRKFSEQSVQYLMDSLNTNYKYYETKLGYGVKELRDDILSFIPKTTNVQSKKISDKNPKELSFNELNYLIFRKIFHTIKSIFLKKNKNQKSQATM